MKPIKIKTEREAKRWIAKKGIKGSTPTKRKSPTRRQELIKELDRVFGEIIRSRGKCERCGRKNIQTAHIFSRSNKATRWDLNNAWCFCNGCHIFWAHQNPVEFTEWTKARLGEKKYNALRKKADTIKQWTILELEELLEKLIKQNG